MELYFEAPRRPGRDLRRLRAGHRRRQPGQRPGRLLPSSSAGTARPARRVVTAQGHYDAAAHLHAHAVAELPAHAGPAAQGAVRDPGGRWACWRRRPRSAAAAGRRSPAARRPSAGADRGQRRFTFINVDAEPVPSLLRGFSAPVVLDCDYTDAAAAARCWRTTPTPSTAGKPGSAWR
jgi:aminopeptidase N